MISFNTFVQVDLDRPLEEVFGAPARTFDRIHAGPAGTMPPTTWEVVEPGRIWVGGETSGHLVLLPAQAT